MDKPTAKSAQPPANGLPLDELPRVTEGDKLAQITVGQLVISVRENKLWRWLVFASPPALSTLPANADYPIQSIMLKRAPQHLALPYMQAMVASLCFDVLPNRPTLLQLGLGGGAINRYIKYYYPQLSLRSVELHAALHGLYQQYFLPPDNLQPDPIIIQCAYQYLRGFNGQHKPAEQYDIIFCDLFGDLFDGRFDKAGAPDFIDDSDFYLGLKNALTDCGVVAINIASRDPVLIQRVFSPVSQFFSEVLIAELEGYENIIIYASQSTLQLCEQKVRTMQSTIHLNISKHFSAAVRAVVSDN